MPKILFLADGTLDTKLERYATAMQAVALENGFNIINLYSSSKSYFESIGEEECLKLSGDRTHFYLAGARILSELICNELALLEIKLDHYL